MACRQGTLPHINRTTHAAVTVSATANPATIGRCAAAATTRTATATRAVITEAAKKRGVIFASWRSHEFHRLIRMRGLKSEVPRQHDVVATSPISYGLDQAPG
jgi:hypothetical protein